MLLTHARVPQASPGAPSRLPSILPAIGPTSASATRRLALTRRDASAYCDPLLVIMPAAVAFASTLPSSPLETPALQLEPCPHPTSAIEALLNSSPFSTLELTHVPPRVCANRPLEIELTGVGLGAGASVTAPVAQWLSGHASLAIDIELSDNSRGAFSVDVSACPSDSGCMIRALVHPASWADATSVTVVSLTVAGRPLTCNRLPAALPVGYNHTPAPQGEVYAAASAGDVPVLQAALDAGGSTEEADRVRRKKGRNAESGLCDGGRILEWKWAAMCQCAPSLHSTTGSVDCLVLRHRPRPPRRLAYAPGSRRQPGHAEPCERRGGKGTLLCGRTRPALTPVQLAMGCHSARHNAPCSIVGLLCMWRLSTAVPLLLPSSSRPLG